MTELQNKMFLSIIKYTGIQLIGWFIYYIVGYVLPSIYPSPIYLPFVIIILICSPAIGFILLGYYLNKKSVNNEVTYGQFMKIGIIITVLSSILFLFGTAFNEYKGDSFTWDSYFMDIKERGLYTIVSLIFVMGVECLIIASFRKKLK